MCMPTPSTLQAWLSSHMCTFVNETARVEICLTFLGKGVDGVDQSMLIDHNRNAQAKNVRLYSSATRPAQNTGHASVA